MDITIDQATFHAVQPVLLGYARRAVRREDLAQDLVQETWSAGTRHLQSFGGRSSFRSWMVGILKHKIIDHYRRAGREQPLEAAPERVLEPAQEQDLDHRRAVDIMRTELQKLPELQRRAVECCDLRGMDRDEAAAELGVERGHLRVLLHRGRAQLRRRLEEAELGP
ncbi:MAG: RNA polymerase sigma factor [Myxococcales bacterium]|nr:RNA polymerase sigma factor [Myxococcales bacterium]